MIDRSQKLQELIDDNPGIQFREIMRSSGLKNGVLSHYLKKLEDGGLVKVMRGPRQVRFYSPNITEEESIVIKALRKETPRDLLLALIKDDEEMYDSIEQIYFQELRSVEEVTQLL